MGYNVNRFVSPVNENFVCNICTNVMKDAVITLCGHSFCEGCLSKWLSRLDRETCPVCRAYTSQYEIIPNISLRNMIRPLNVWCDNNHLGCHVVTKLENYEQHELICDYRLVKCSACNESVLFCNLAYHCTECVSSVNKKQNDDKITAELLSQKIRLLELELSNTKNDLKKSKERTGELETELNELREQANSWVNTSNLEFDPDYSYGYSPSSISQLSCLIAKNLLSKPPNIDRGRIFMAIKRSFTYYHNYAGYVEDVHMLLATAKASNWFPEHNRWTLERWLEQISHEIFPRTNTTSTI